MVRRIKREGVRRDGEVGILMVRGLPPGVEVAAIVRVDVEGWKMARADRIVDMTAICEGAISIGTTSLLRCDDQYIEELY